MKKHEHENKNSPTERISIQCEYFVVWNRVAHFLSHTMGYKMYLLLFWVSKSPSINYSCKSVKINDLPNLSVFKKCFHIRLGTSQLHIGQVEPELVFKVIYETLDDPAKHMGWTFSGTTQMLFSSLLLSIQGSLLYLKNLLDKIL